MFANYVRIMEIVQKGTQITEISSTISMIYDGISVFFFIGDSTLNISVSCERWKKINKNFVFFHTKKKLSSLELDDVVWNFNFVVYTSRTSPVLLSGGKLIWKTARDSSLNIIIFITTICRGEWDGVKESERETEKSSWWRVTLLSAHITSCDNSLARWASSSWHFRDTENELAKKYLQLGAEIELYFKRQS